MKNVKKFNVKVIEAPQTLKVYIDDLLHLSVDKSKVISMQSWIYGHRGVYIIEFQTEKTSVKCEYASKALWESILKLLDKYL